MFKSLLGISSAALVLFSASSASIATVTARRLAENSPEYQRFLQEQDALAQELEQWKQSPAGEYAREYGYYKDDSDVLQSDGESGEASQDQLERFFLTKLGIEKSRQENPEATFSVNTPFTLMTEEEFTAFVGQSFQLGSPPAANLTATATSGASAAAVTVAPATAKDWSTESTCVTRVKNQGGCGSCWAFAAVGALESAYCIQTGKPQLFSEQQVVNCDTTSRGCSGGWPHKALAYVQKNGGICTGESYWYYPVNTECVGTCVHQPIKTKSIVYVAANEASLVKAVSQQPVAVVLAAGSSAWKQYAGGVLTTCPADGLSHAVLAVGYSDKFIKIKNSWGTWWGDKGYIYLGRGTSACGVVNQYNVYPELEAPCNC